jgi:fatty-acyl-CoA synthase
MQPSPPPPKPTLAAADGSQPVKIYAPDPVEEVEAETALHAPEAELEQEIQPAGEPLAASEAPSPQTPPETQLIAAEPEVDAKAPAAPTPEAKPLSAADAIIAEAAAIAAAGSKPAEPVTVAEAKAPEAKPDTDAPLRLHEPDKVEAPKPPPQAKPVAAEATPFAVPITPGRKSKAKAGKTKGEKAKPGWASTYLDFAVLVALTPAILAGGGALGVKLGLIDLPLGYNLMTLDWAPRAAQVGVATGLIGLVIALFAGFGRLWKAALLALLITGATFGVMFGAKALFGQAPPIHDVATDWKTPLVFSDAALAARGGAAAFVDDDPSLPVGSAAFAGRRIAEINAETCPAARPLVSSRSPADAYEAAKAAVLASGMTLITDDPMDGRLEATAKSFWYGLTDDVVMRVRPDAAGSRLDMRSIGRDAGPDLGRNCDRIGALMTAVKGG